VLLGIDLGTGSVKALLLASDGRVLGEASSSYAVSAPRPGWAETDPSDWWQGTCEAVRRAVGEHPREVTALGLSGQMHGVVPCLEDGTPLRPAILWADMRSSATLAAYQALVPGQRSRLANPVAAGMAGPSLLWLREHERDVYRAARWALQPKDWLRLRLTGTVHADPSDASATLLFDLQQDRWSDEITGALGLRNDWLAPIRPSHEIAGALTDEAAAELGLEAGLPVATGAADAAASAFGSGLIAPGQVQINIGTAMQIFAIRDAPVIDPTLRTHLYRSATGGWYAMAAMQNAGIALEWVREILGLSWEEMYQQAFEVAAGCEGVTFLPYLTGERTPHLDPEIRGAWSGLALSHDRAHLARASFEGVAFALKDGLKALEQTGIEAETLRLAGGGTLQSSWRQLLADVLGKPLYAVSVPSASAKGAALLAGLAGGVFKSISETASLSPEPELVATPTQQPELESAFGRFRALYPAIKEGKQ
jgi:xylulokinase